MKGPAGVEDVASAFVTLGVRVAAAWAWRIILIVAALALLAIGVAYLRIVVIPVLIAGLLTALLKPVVDRLQRRGLRRGFGVLLAMLILLGVVAAMFWIIGTQVGSGLRDMGARAQEFSAIAREWLYTSPFHVTDSQIAAFLTQVRTSVQADSAALLNGVISVGSTAGHVAAGTLLTAFSLIFLLLDSRRIFDWVVRLFPRGARAAVDGAARVGWRTVSSYVRVQIFVAFVDAVGITVGAAFLGLPMLLPIGLFVFLASFVPFLGAIVSGLFVCLVALVYQGFWPAVIMLIIVVAVQQLEAHVLQPFVMGSAVRVHPLAVVLAVTVGALVAGIPGTLFAVPTVAAANVMISYVGSGAWRRPDASRPDPEEIGDGGDRPGGSGPGSPDQSQEEQ